MKISEVAVLWRRAITAMNKVDEAVSLMLEGELASQEREYLQGIEAICEGFTEALNRRLS